MAKAQRGRLSSIDLLPEEALPHVRAAIEALSARRRTQDEIREELNSHLLALGLDPVSRSAFNRKALAIAAYGQQLTRAREIAAIMAEKLDEVPEGDVGLLLTETLKCLVYDLVMEQSLAEEAPSVDMLRKSADAVMRLERARKMNVETADNLRRNFAKRAEAAIDAAEAGGAIDRAAAEKARQIMGFAS